jgi:hypothetical protein
MSDTGTDDEDPKKPHDRVIPRKGASRFEDEAPWRHPWRHCEDEQRDARRLV